MKARTLATCAASACMALWAVAPPALAAFPGQNGRIAFVRDNLVAGTAIWSMEPDANDQRRLTSSGGESGEPAWSRDGTRIVFSSDRNGTFDIWVMNADGSDQRRITSGPAGEHGPSFSPDGRQIVFSDDRGSTSSTSVSELWLVDVDGSNPRPLTAEGGVATSPAWSPDGGTIAFVFTGPQSTEEQMWRIPAAGGTAISPITAPGGSGVDDPDWSPDGSRLIFGTDFGDILSVDRTGGDLRRLDVFPGSESEAVWSPDGLFIAHRMRGDVWVAPRDDFAHPLRLTNGFQPSWQPKVQSPTTPENQPPPPGGGGPATSPDADGDGFTPAQGDCDDGNAKVGPTAREVPGNGGDENCDGRSDPYPVVAGRASMVVQRDRAQRRVFVRTLRVIDLAGGEAVTVSCTGRCSRNLRRLRVAPARPGTLSLKRRTRNGWIRFGSTLRVRIERSGYSTRIEAFTMRPTGDIPWHLRRRCELPGGGGDWNCNGAPDLPLLRARTSLDTARRGHDTVLRRLRLRELQGGEFVALACKGKGCVRRLTRTQTVPAGTTRLRLDRVVRGVRLEPGARLELTISKTRFASAINRWTMRRGGAPRAARLCLEPGDNRAGDCG